MSEAATVTTPNDMPGAKADDNGKPDAVTEVATDKSDTAPKGDNLDAAERAELERLRGLHKDEQKYRREATENHADATAYRKLLEGLGVDGKAKKDFDPQAAIADLNTKFEQSEKARMRAEVARTEGVEPEDFTGDTEEEMRASAQRFKQRIEAEVEKRAKAVAPSAAPAGEVTSNGKVDGPKQITSRDQLKKMSPKQIIEARENGRLDDLAGSS